MLDFVGCIYAMAPARVGHARQAGAITAALREQVRAPSEVLTEGPLLLAADNALVPDMWVVCSQPDNHTTELLDAELAVEVLSPSSRPGETEAKRLSYLTLPSLVAYLVVDGDTDDAWTRIGDDGPWQCATVKAGEFSAFLHGREVRL